MVHLEEPSSWSGSSGSSSIALPPGPSVMPTSFSRITILSMVEKTWMESLQLPLDFIIYVFSLPLQLSDRKILEIQLMVQEWVRWDILESLAKYHSTVKTLFGILKDALTRDSLWISHIIAEEILECLSRDVNVLHDKLLAIFCHSESYKRFLTCRGTLAQQLIDLLQDVLDSVPESSARPRLSKALIRLSRASGLHPTCFPLTDLQIRGHQVAAGAFGDIWKGLVRGQSVSVKVMRVFRDVEVRAAVEAFGREALIWRQLSHRNLLPFFGLYYLETRLCLVSPWMTNGHVLQFLENASPDTDRVSLMLDVAMGLEYLHAKHVVHGDLKGMNILVTPSHRACVADFGLSSIVNRSTLRFTHSTASARGGGTARYQAPELLLGEKQSHYGSDIYAFACVCYEIMTGKAPFFELFLEAQVIFKVLKGIRPTRPESIPFDDSLWLLLLDCWKAQSCDRPDASQIIQHLAGPTIGAKTVAAAVDWDDTISSRCRRSLRDWSLLPSVATIERRIFGDAIVDACRECFPERFVSDTQDHLPLILSPSNHDLPPRWHPSGILSPIHPDNSSAGETLPLLGNLRSTFIPISCLAHHATENSDGRSPQMCRVFVSARDLPVVPRNLPPMLPGPLAAEPSRPPTPNNFSFLLKNYQRMLAKPPSDVSSSNDHSSSQPFTSRHFQTQPAMHLDGNHSLLSTPDLSLSFTSPQETPSDNFAPTPDGSPFEGFSPQLFPPMSDDILEPSLHREWYNSGLSLFGGEQLP